MTWQGSGIYYQDSVSFLDRYISRPSRNWNAYVWKQQEPPPQTIQMALDMSYNPTSAVQFVNIAPEWKAQVTISVGSANAKWPGTNCGLSITAQLSLNGISNFNPAYNPLYITTPYIWQVASTYSPSGTTTSVSLNQESYTTATDLVDQLVLSSDYASGNPTWPSTLNWADTQCNYTPQPWYKCYQYGVMAAQVVPTINESATSVSGSTSQVSGAYSPPYRFVNGFWTAPYGPNNTSQGSLTQIGVSMTL
jgi:hypothetical protein